MQLHKLIGGQLLVVLFHKLIDSIIIHLQFPDLGQRHNLVGSTGYCLRLLNATFDNTLRLKLLPSRSEILSVTHFSCIFDHFKMMRKRCEVIFLIFAMSKVGP
ncbi:hypothetical protein AVEN_215373-1 [Araneus ventricosus]|uniref:Uncharacterized protein n=1 Tax=Araneus ventricosus TaxID=182803 RepID=A0A4Y2KUW1_ARAVE|nr:hypothetical protein AVEN_215373-1 [Araneus ventricosus]